MQTNSKCSSPIRLVQNMLNKLKIRCVFFPKGCMEIATVETIEGHQKYCLFDKELCKTCGFVSDSEHDCLRSLIDYKTNMSTIMDKMQKELEDSNTQNRNLRAQIDNYMRTIQDLTKDRSAQMSSNNNGNNSSSSKTACIKAVVRSHCPSS